MSSLSSSDVSSLQSILSKLQSNPSLLQSSDLAFFRDYIKTVAPSISSSSSSSSAPSSSSASSSKPHATSDPHWSAEHGHSHAPGSGAHGGVEHGPGHGHGHGAGADEEDEEMEDQDDSDDDADAPFVFNEPEVTAFDSTKIEYEPNALLDDLAAKAASASSSSSSPTDDAELPPLGDASKEPTDDDLESAQASKASGVAALESKDFASALRHFTDAILKNPHSTILVAQRADVLLAQGRVEAAIRDCEKALQANPDSARALRTRGRAYVALGKWLEAHKDLSVAQRIDYQAGEIQSLLQALQSRIDLVHKKETENRKSAEERELRRRVAMKEYVENRQKKQERRRQKEEMKARFGGARAGFGPTPGMGRGGAPGAGFGGMPGMGGMGGMPGMPGMGAIPPHLQQAAAQLMSDPELMSEVSKNPKVMSAISALMKDPNYKSGDPEVDRVIAKIVKKLGGAGAGAGAAGAGTRTGSAAPKFAPDLDVD